MSWGRLREYQVYEDTDKPETLDRISERTSTRAGGVMQSWLAGIVLGYAMRRLRAGDPRLILLLDAPEVTLTFPGDSSWAGVYRGKPAVERWLRRFAATGLQIYPDQVVASGFPWKTTACIRGRSTCATRPA